MRGADLDALAARVDAVERQAGQAHGDAAFQALYRMVASRAADLAGIAVYADDLADRAHIPAELDTEEAAALAAISPADEAAAEMTTAEYLAALATIVRLL